MHFVKNNHGVSLVATMVAVGMTGLITLAVVQLLDIAYKGTATTTFSLESNSLQYNVTSFLTDRLVCENNFNNLSLTPLIGNPTANIPVTTITNLDGTTVFQVLPPTPTNTDILSIDLMQLENWRPYSLAGNHQYKGTADLVVVSRANRNTMGAGFKAHRVQINLVLKGFNATPIPADANEIASCFAVGSGINSLWSQNPNGQIYYGDGAVSGYVGVGTSAPTEALHVNGNVAATAFLYTSDERLKKDFREINSIEILESINAYYFRWTENDSNDIGLKAQEVQKVLPEIIHTNKLRDHLMIDYIKLIPVLVDANKKLIKRIDSLEQKLQNEN